jgi:hypothetical protein
MSLTTIKMDLLMNVRPLLLKLVHFKTLNARALLLVHGKEMLKQKLIPTYFFLSFLDF